MKARDIDKGAKEAAKNIMELEKCGRKLARYIKACITCEKEDHMLRKLTENLGTGITVPLLKEEIEFQKGLIYLYFAEIWKSQPRIKKGFIRSANKLKREAKNLKKGVYQ